MITWSNTAPQIEGTWDNLREIGQATVGDEVVRSEYYTAKVAGQRAIAVKAISYARMRNGLSGARIHMGSEISVNGGSYSGHNDESMVVYDSTWHSATWYAVVSGEKISSITARNQIRTSVSVALAYPKISSVVPVKVGGAWKEAEPFVKVGGEWKEAQPFARVNGAWKEAT